MTRRIIESTYAAGGPIPSRRPGISSWTVVAVPLLVVLSKDTFQLGESGPKLSRPGPGRRRSAYV